MKVKFHGQVNIGEGLAPQYNVWLAEVRSPSCKPKNHFGQKLRKSRKQFGRRFNNVDSWFKKRKRRYNLLQRIKNTAELPVEIAKAAPSTYGKKSKFPLSSLHVGLTFILGLALLGVSLDLGTTTALESCQRIATSLWEQALQLNCCNLFQTACQVTGLITAPLLWAMMLITLIKGESCPHQHFQVDSPTPRHARRQNEQHARKLV